MRSLRPTTPRCTIAGRARRDTTHRDRRDPRHYARRIPGRTCSAGRAWWAAALAAALLGPLAIPTVAAAPPAADTMVDPPDHVLVIAIPGLGWRDITSERTPHLRTFLEEAAVAGLSTRVKHRLTEPGEAYVTIGAGNRAVAEGTIAAPALAPDEPFATGTAAEEYARLNGQPMDAAAALLTIESLKEENDSADFGAHPGTIGEALLEANRTTAVVANADRPIPLDLQPLFPWDSTVAPEIRREAVSALMDDDGQVPAGRVDAGLRRADPEAAYGSRLDPDAVLAAVEGVWDQDRVVVLVEASDLLLADAAGEEATPEAADALEQRALAWTDDLVGRLLAETDPEHDAVIVVAPTPRDEAQLTVLGMQVPGQEGGWLESPQTRRAGFVTLPDVGPTILDVAGVVQPDGIEGRPVTVTGTDQTGNERIEAILDADATARARDDLVLPVTKLYTWLAILTTIGAAACFVHRRFGGLARGATLTLVSALPWTYLAGPFDVADHGLAAYVGFVTVGALLTAGGIVAISQASPLRRLHPLGPSALWATLTLAVMATSVVVLDSALQLSTVFGDSPILAGRFSGVNNLTFAQITVAGLLLATLVVRTSRLAHGTSTARAHAAAVGVLVAVILLDGMPMWGADVGGVLAALPAFAVAWLGLAGRRVRWRALIGWGVAAVAAIVALGLLDLARPAESRSHLGRLFERIGDDGVRGLTLVVERKLHQNLRSITTQPWTWLVVMTAATIAFLLWRHRERVLAPFRSEPELRAAGAGLAVALLLGFALNDSGVAVPGMMLATTLPVATWVLMPPRRPKVSADTSGEAAERAQPDESATTATSGTFVTTPSTPSAASDRI